MAASFPWRRVVELARPEARTIGAATAALLISSGMSLAYPAAIREIVDAVVGAGDRDRLNQAALLLVVAFFIQALFAHAARVAVHRGRRAGGHPAARELYEAVIRQDIAFFDEVRTGELTNRLASDTSGAAEHRHREPLDVAAVHAGRVRRRGAAVRGCRRGSPVTMAIVPLVAIGATVFGRMIRTLSARCRTRWPAGPEIAEETSRACAPCGRSPGGREVARYSERQLSDSYDLAARRAFAYGAFQGVAGFAGLRGHRHRRVVRRPPGDRRPMTLGELTAFLLYTLMVAMSLGALAGLYGDFMRAFGRQRAGV
jgi:ABC-type multidrug transport system fused ATPase/permease subunit